MVQLTAIPFPAGAIAPVKRRYTRLSALEAGTKVECLSVVKVETTKRNGETKVTYRAKCAGDIEYVLTDKQARTLAYAVKWAQENVPEEANRVVCFTIQREGKRRVTMA